MKKILVMILPLLAFLGGAVGGDLLHGGASKASQGSPGGETGDEAGEKAEPGAEAEAEAGPEAEAVAETQAHAAPASGGEAGGDAGHEGGKAAEGNTEDWFHFPNQFFVPILRNGSTTAVMVLSLTLEMPATARTKVETQEHRLRDALLNALMIQANTGGFDGNFTSETSLDALRAALLAAARKAGGPEISGVLIEDIARQDQ